MKQLTSKNYIFLFLLGASLGPILDGFHTHSGTTGYLNPFFMLMAWWVPLLFGSATIVVGTSHLLTDRLFKNRRQPVSLRSCVIALSSFSAVYFASAFWQQSHLVKLLAFTAESIVLWFFLDRHWTSVIEALATALVGCAIEIAISSTGHFWYVQPEFYGIPFWLCTLYFNASLAIGRIARYMVQPKRHLG